MLRALRLQVRYGIRSEPQLVEPLHDNLLFRWLVGLSIEDAVWNPSTFGKNRDRLLEHAVPELFAKVVPTADDRGLPSADHFSADGTLIQTWASPKSFRPKDEGPGEVVGRNRERDVHGEARKNDTHASVADPEARLYRKSSNTVAMRCYQGHTVVEIRNGPVVRAKINRRLVSRNATPRWNCSSRCPVSGARRWQPTRATT